MNFLKSLKNILTATCGCGKKATQFPHGVPCCDDCAHEPDCLIWLGDDCTCGKDQRE